VYIREINIDNNTFTITHVSTIFLYIISYKKFIIIMLINANNKLIWFIVILLSLAVCNYIDS